MIDTGLLVQALRNAGHTVGAVTPLPSNAGDYEIEVDGNLLTLEQVRALLETDLAI